MAKKRARKKTGTKSKKTAKSRTAAKPIARKIFGRVTIDHKPPLKKLIEAVGFVAPFVALKGSEDLVELHRLLKDAEADFLQESVELVVRVTKK